ncbi:MAG: glyoxylase family protein [Actinomycetota bacterium]|jgi:glyoxylase I family protein|nr:glyoxylase family protein [Actinomycetota bacterium]
MPSITGAHHVAVTVRDIAKSEAWYAEVLGLQTLLARDDDETFVRVMADPASGWIFGLRQHRAHPDGEFSEFRTGLDHFAFTVGSREELDAWEAELEKRGITYTPAKETPIGTLIAFRDPDNIALELWLPLGS